MTSLDKLMVKSQIGVINIQYGGEKITLSLARELRITEEKINEEIQKQPSKYGFCLMLLGKLRTEFEDLKTTRKKIYGKLYQRAKTTKVESTGRPMSDDLAKAYVESHKDYVEITRRCTQAKGDHDQIYSLVKAFEERAFLIQTLSSNIRKEI